MKKTLIIFLCAILTINCLAISTGDGSYDYVIDDTNITIEFESNSAFSSEKQQQIADHMAYGDDGVSTYAWCWLTGHNLVTEAVTVIEHKVYATTPRCIKYTYAVEICTKCDHLEETLVSQARYACCPVE